MIAKRFHNVIRQAPLISISETLQLVLKVERHAKAHHGGFVCHAVNMKCNTLCVKTLDYL